MFYHHQVCGDTVEIQNCLKFGSTLPRLLKVKPLPQFMLTSDDHEVFMYEKYLHRLWQKLLQGSPFLILLFGIFVFYVAVVVFSVLLLIFTVWPINWGGWEKYFHLLTFGLQKLFCVWLSVSSLYNCSLNNYSRSRYFLDAKYWFILEIHIYVYAMCFG